MWTFAILASLMIDPVAAASPDSITGEWKNRTQTVAVQILPCGVELCGHVTWASQSAQEDSARAGTEHLVGTQVLYGLRPAGPDRWRGMLFIPDLGRRTRASVVRKGPDKLQVIGCESLGLICRKQTWSRAREAEAVAREAD